MALCVEDGREWKGTYETARQTRRRAKEEYLDNPRISCVSASGFLDHEIDHCHETHDQTAEYGDGQAEQ